MSSNSPKDTQQFRAQFVETLINGRPAESISNVMLQADAIVKFVQTGEIVGLSPTDDERGPLLIKRRQRVGATH